MIGKIEVVPARIDVLTPGVRPRFEAWIAERGGVRVWPCVDLSAPSTGDTFTPALTDGVPTGKPHWSVVEGELVNDISRFRFVKEMREVDRFRVALRPGANGLKIKLTDASSEKLRKRTARAGEDACYRFDFTTQEAVIEVPEWEPGP